MLTRWASGCRLHGDGCRTSWGWDAAHTDSPRPYTLDELAERQEPPHFYAYPSKDDYLLGWHTWRAVRRDRRPSPAEAEVLMAGILDRVNWIWEEEQGRRSAAPGTIT